MILSNKEKNFLLLILFVLVIILINYIKDVMNKKEYFDTYILKMGSFYLGRNNSFTDDRKNAIEISYEIKNNIMLLRKIDDHYVRYLKYDPINKQIKWDEHKIYENDNYKWIFTTCDGNNSGYLLQPFDYDARIYYLTKTNDNKLSLTSTKDKSYPVQFIN